MRLSLPATSSLISCISLASTNSTRSHTSLENWLTARAVLLEASTIAESLMVTFCSTNRFKPVSQRHAPCWEMQLLKVELERVSEVEG
jgi:hypothetical protein